MTTRINLVKHNYSGDIGWVTEAALGALRCIENYMSTGGHYWRQRKNEPLYEAFEPAEARRLTDRLDIHFKPKHGSWLNMVEIELSTLNNEEQINVQERVLADDTMETSAIEGEVLRRSSVRASIRKQLGLPVEVDDWDAHADHI